MTHIAEKKLTCFKAYDIRGKIGEELNEDIAWRIGCAYAQCLNPRQVVVGSDARLTSEPLKMALARGLMDAGCDVIDIGLAGTEEIYFSTFHLHTDGGIEITASHNPIDYNGMKLVRSGAEPISADSGLREIQRLTEENNFPPVDESNRGHYQKINILSAYVDHLLSFINIDNFRHKPLRLVLNSGNGAAGHVIDELERRFTELSLPVEFTKVHNCPDGTFPHGIPNPLLPESRQETINAVIHSRANLGIAFDGDFDRCFLFDEKGTFVEGYYIVGLLAEAFLNKESGVKIIHDPRVYWNTIDIIEQHGGIPVMSKTGHAFIKERMRKENAIYGGEMSSHHYFRNFAYCDSGMIPWLLVTELLLTTGKPLSELVKTRIAKYPVSGEINRQVSDAESLINAIERRYAPVAVSIDYTDGLSMSFNDWRFNIRTSNTEPLLRLNVETKGDSRLMQQKTNELLALINK